MNKVLISIIILVVVLVGGFYALNAYIYNEKQGDGTENMNSPSDPENMEVDSGLGIAVTPISHATMVLKWGDKIIYTDPVGGAAAFVGQPEPDVILVTDNHGDHFNLETLQAVAKDKTTIVIPDVLASDVANLLPGNIKILNNGQVLNDQGFAIQAVPMYNVPESDTAYHVKGRGNGYVVEANGKRVYFSGDSGNTAEMRALQNIDLAFVAMNLPFTMSVEDAANAVLAFKPKTVTPYHYRGTDGLSDTSKFRELVNQGNPDIVVDLINFYQ